MAEQTPDPRRFLEGSFAPVSEEITAFDLPVTGQVPAELTGRYLRNGPNPMGLDDPDYHWFLGSGMVHGVRLRDGRARVVPQPVGPLQGRRRRPTTSSGRAGRCTRAWTSRPTPTSSGTAAGRWPRWRPGRCPTS